MYIQIFLCFSCQNSGLTCPLEDKTNYTYTASIPISPAYPKVILTVYLVSTRIKKIDKNLLVIIQIKVLVKWELQEASGKDLFCIEIPSAIMA